jgi:hypothetical protein
MKLYRAYVNSCRIAPVQSNCPIDVRGAYVANILIVEIIKIIYRLNYLENVFA